MPLHKKWWQPMKKFIALAWWRAADENIPLSAKKCVVDNGAIPKAPPLKQSEENVGKGKMANGKAPDPEISNPEDEPMSMLRKFAMFLSLNVIALYLAAFAWLIPCKLTDCKFGHEWTVDLDNMSVSTNLEVSGSTLSTLLFGYIHGSNDSQGVTAIVSSSGSVKWKIMLDYSPVYCRCDVVDINGDGVMDCLIFSEAHLLALNASNGHVFWTQELRAISPLSVTIDGCDDTKWVVLVEDQGFLSDHFTDQKRKSRIGMVFLHSRNGTVIVDLPLPCDSFPKQLVTWKSKTNVTQIAFQCSHEDRTEVQLISEEELCNSVLGRSQSRSTDFSSVFSFGSSTAVDDVSLLPVTPMGLMIGWSTVIAMATDARNPPRLLWQTTSGSIKSAIKFVLGGHFTSRNSTQIAIVVQDDSSNSVKIIDASDGKEVQSVELGTGTILSIRPVSRTMESNDSLLIVKEGGSASTNHTVSNVTDFSSTDENAFVTDTADVSRQAKTYFLLTLGRESKVTELLTENRRAEIAVNDGECTVVFLATSLFNRTTRISSRILKDFSSKNSCSCR